VNSRLPVALVLAGIMLAGIGCRVTVPKTPKVMTMDKKVELGQAESTRVSITIGIGKLNITGGAEGVLDARFEYEIPDWKPEVTYEVEDGLGRLAVSQPDSGSGAKADVRYDWNLKLKDKVPTDLVIEMGAGKVDLDMRRVNLRGLKVTVGVGEGRIDLSNVSGDLNAKVEAGAGKLKLLMPSDVGVKVKAEGIGHVEAPTLNESDEGWTNDAWGKSRVSVTVYVSGIGEVEIKTVARQAI
jgi:hypothetical protein